MDVREPASPPDAPPRLSDLPFPRYRYVPGLNPHPIRDPNGHSYGLPEPDVSVEVATLVTNWRSSPYFRYGIDLYNYAYWWEAHEAWETLWHRFAPDSRHRHAIQGLIQVSAAHLKRHLGQERGVRDLLARARDHLDQASPAGPVVFGIQVESWWNGRVLPFFSGAPGAPFPFLVPV